MRHRKFLVMIGSLIGILLSACNGSALKPEAALWGHWAYAGGEGGSPAYAADLLFQEDGVLTFLGRPQDAATYVVIAPGRMKVTMGVQSQVISYQVVEDELQLNFEGATLLFKKIEEPKLVAQNAIATTILPTRTNSSTVLPSTLTPMEAIPTNTPIPSTATETFTTTAPVLSETPISSLEEKYIDYMINPKDGMPMVFVPEGEFIMGSNPNEDPFFWGAEGPAHDVYVDAFWIYQTEVTNAMFQACVAEQACPRPLRYESRTVADYYTAEKYTNYPVIQVNWVHAVAYCRWAGGRLPTEAEWEKAARGTDGRLFPWGNSPLIPVLASFCGINCPGSEKEEIDDGYLEIAPVGVFPTGASPYGALDMAGNVWEWVFDYFDQNFYSRSEYDNPRGPASGSRRVIRGGSWFNPADGLRTVSRSSLPPQVGLDTVGFRCVHEIKE